MIDDGLGGSDEFVQFYDDESGHDDEKGGNQLLEEASGNTEQGQLSDTQRQGGNAKEGGLNDKPINDSQRIDMSTIINRYNDVYQRGQYASRKARSDCRNATTDKTHTYNTDALVIINIPDDDGNSVPPDKPSMGFVHLDDYEIIHNKFSMLAVGIDVCVDRSTVESTYYIKDDEHFNADLWDLKQCVYMRLLIWGQVKLDSQNNLVSVTECERPWFHVLNGRQHTSLGSLCNVSGIGTKYEGDIETLRGTFGTIARAHVHIYANGDTTKHCFRMLPSKSIGKQQKDILKTYGIASPYGEIGPFHLYCALDDFCLYEHLDKSGRQRRMHIARRRGILRHLVMDALSAIRECKNMSRIIELLFCIVTTLRTLQEVTINMTTNFNKKSYTVREKDPSLMSSSEYNEHFKNGDNFVKFIKTVIGTSQDFIECMPDFTLYIDIFNLRIYAESYATRNKKLANCFTYMHFMQITWPFSMEMVKLGCNLDLGVEGQNIDRLHIISFCCHICAKYNTGHILEYVEDTQPTKLFIPQSRSAEIKAVVDQIITDTYKSAKKALLRRGYKPNEKGWGFAINNVDRIDALLGCSDDKRFHWKFERASNWPSIIVFEDNSIFEDKIMRPITQWKIKTWQMTSMTITRNNNILDTDAKFPVPILNRNGDERGSNFFGLLGPTNSGKTTLQKILMFIASHLCRITTFDKYIYVNREKNDLDLEEFCEQNNFELYLVDYTLVKANLISLVQGEAQFCTYLMDDALGNSIVIKNMTTDTVANASQPRNNIIVSLQAITGSNQLVNIRDSLNTIMTFDNMSKFKEKTNTYKKDHVSQMITTHRLNALEKMSIDGGERRGWIYDRKDAFVASDRILSGELFALCNVN